MQTPTPKLGPRLSAEGSGVMWGSRPESPSKEYQGQEEGKGSGMSLLEGKVPPWRRLLVSQGREMWPG